MSEGGRGLLDGLPGLLLEATVDGLGDGRLHQVDVAHHQRHEDGLQVSVERPVAQVSYRTQVSTWVSQSLTSAKQAQEGLKRSEHHSRQPE